MESSFLIPRQRDGQISERAKALINNQNQMSSSIMVAMDIIAYAQ